MMDLTVNDQQISVEEGTTVLEACSKLGIKIPTLCYHKSLAPVGACRICLVEITQRGKTRIQASCTYRAEEGLVVRTDSEKVLKTRKIMVELLLARCPDVPKIKELAAEMGVEDTRFPKKNEKCILCGLCLRVCQERMDVGAINFVNRGADRKVIPPFDEHSPICVTCGACDFVCPTGAVELSEITENKPRPILSEYDVGLVSRPSIYIPYVQAVPKVPAIDRDTCMHFLKGACKSCENFCEAKAINYEQEDEIAELDVGAIIFASGFENFDPNLKGEYGYGRFPNVLTSIQFERVLSASGPYQGHVQRPSDGKTPKKIAWIQCVGSRDASCGNPYCSSVCCMYATKEAVIAKEHVSSDLGCHIYFMDMRAFGKDFDKYYERAKDEYGVEFRRSRISAIEEIPETKDLKIKYESEDGRLLSETYDMVVLSTGLVPPKDMKNTAEIFGVELNKYGFLKTKPFLPVATTRPGIYVCGSSSEPKDIPETVTQASAAALLASSPLASARGTLITKKEYPPEIDVSDQEPRIGVFICFCGINIGGVVDVEKVTEFAKGLPDVAYAENNLYTCSQDTQENIKAKIAELNLNKIIVASCTPRTHESLFQDTIREAGLNPYLFEMANIRDQCSWVHMREPDKATEKAKDAVAMAVAKARLIKPLKQESVGLVHKGLVVGGGLSGLVAALSLAHQGFEVYLIEREETLGGNLRHIYYTLDGPNPQELLAETIRLAEENELIHIYKRSRVEETKGYVGNYKTTIYLAEEDKRIELEHGVFIVATGARPYQPKEYLYGKDEKVITQQELEEKIHSNGKVVTESENVVMIQCVGSRCEERPYCSRICCSSALKNALKIKEANPAASIYILYRDIRTYGFKEEYYRKARELGVVFIRYTPENEPRITSENGRLSLLVDEPLLGIKLKINPDLLVLSTGIVPDDNEDLAKILKVPLTSDRYFLEAHVKLRPVDFATDGLFLCGLAHSPKSIDEAITQAQAASARAVTFLSQENIQAKGIVVEVNERLCSGCGICVEACAFDAREIDEERKISKVTEVLCQGCGACASACPNAATQQRGFEKSQELAKINAALAT